jgi:hypothetical protein
MPPHQPGLFDFVREAFKVPNNLILFIGGLLAGVVSMQPMVFWPLTLGIEILYLAGMANHPGFQELVKARWRAAGAAGSMQSGQRLVATLDPSRRARFERLLARCRELQRGTPAGDVDQVSGILESQQTQGVNKLLWVFLRTLAQEQVLADLCGSTPAAEIERTIARTEKQIAEPGLSEAVQAAYQENLDVLKQRLDNLVRARQNLDTIGVRLERIENSIMLVQEQALTRKDPNFVEAEVRNVTEGLHSVEEMMRSMNLPEVGSADEAIPEFVRPGGTPAKQGGR